MSNNSISPFIIKATIAASLGGVLFGYDLGIISAALPQLTNTFGLSSKQQEMVVSFLYIGCCIGAMVGGFLCDKYGRKRTILLTDVLFIIGAIVLYMAKDWMVVLWGRVLVGCAVAISGIADVAYLHEISPSQYRGSIVSCNEACISLGFLMSYITGYFMSIMMASDSNWRYMFLTGCVIALVQFLAMVFMPESPIWLKQMGRCQEAKYALMQIYGDGFDYVDMTSQQQASFGIYHDGDSSKQTHHQNGNGLNPREHPTMTRSPANSSSSLNKWTTLNSSPSSHQSYSAFQVGELSPTTSFSSSHNISISNRQLPSHEDQQPESILQYTKKYYRQVIIAIFLSVMQQFCGHPNVLNFAPSIFSQIGFNSLEGKLISTVLVGVAKFFTTCIVIYKIEALGRRFLLLLGLSIIAFSLLLLTLAYMSENAAGTDMDDDDEDNHVRLSEKIAATIGVFGVAIGYAMSFGPLVWLLVSEMFPSSIRGRALGGSTILTYMSASLVSYTFLSGQTMFGSSVPFAVYCILTMSSIAFTHKLIPDTAGKTPDTIHVELEDMWTRSSQDVQRMKHKT